VLTDREFIATFRFSMGRNPEFAGIGKFVGSLLGSSVGKGFEEFPPPLTGKVTESLAEYKILTEPFSPIL
jgi:hypothetical protein